MSRASRIAFGRDPRRTLVRIAVLIVISVITFGWLLTPIRVSGISMEPSYRDSTYNLVNRFIYALRAPARGDVVAIRLAGPRVLYVKRIVGLPGERVSIEKGTVFVDGQPLPEPYVSKRQPWDYAEVTIGPREFFVVGDNRGMRMKDHDFGRVDRRRILGKLVF